VTGLLRIPSRAVEHSLELIRGVGEAHREVAVFWLGSPSTFFVDTIVLPVGRGVQWNRLSLRLSEEWMVVLGEVCERRELVVLGAVHSHPEAAFFSAIDRDAFFHAPDCVSVVLPSYGATAMVDAAQRWGVFVGLPFNQWRPSTWEAEVSIVTGTHELLRLGIDE
jgi:hypothetical protein